MNFKRNIWGIVCGVIILITLVIACNWNVIYYTIRPGKEIADIGQSLRLNYEKDQASGGLFSYCAGFSWNTGEIEISINSVEYYDNFEEAKVSIQNLPNGEMPQIDASNTKIMLVSLHMKNTNAKFQIQEEDYTVNADEKAPYEFLINCMRLGWEDDFGPGKTTTLDPFTEEFREDPIYFNAHPLYDDAKLQAQKYFYFSLPQGQEADYILGFVGSEEALKHHKRVLSVGISTNKKYGLRLNKIREGTVA